MSPHIGPPGQAGCEAIRIKQLARLGVLLTQLLQGLGLDGALHLRHRLAQQGGTEKIDVRPGRGNGTIITDGCVALEEAPLHGHQHILAELRVLLQPLQALLDELVLLAGLLPLTENRQF
eukprot:825529-Lingulodinium_polyedra.AAC.1